VISEIFVATVYGLAQLDAVGLALTLGPLFFGLCTVTSVVLLIALRSARRRQASLPPAPILRYPKLMYLIATLGLLLCAPLFLFSSIWGLMSEASNEHDLEQNPVARIEARLSKGSLVFLAPSEIEMGETGSASINISVGKGAKELEVEVLSAASAAGAAATIKDTTTIRVSSRMQARLVGEDIDVVAMSPEVQAVGGSKGTEWKWSLSPKREGLHRVYATVAAVVQIEDKETPLVLQTYDKTIIVRTNAIQEAKEFASKNWQWAWTALFVPLIAYIWKLRKPEGQPQTAKKATTGRGRAKVTK